MRIVISLILALVGVSYGDTGGLQELPALSAQANALSATNEGFESGHAWNLTGWSVDTGTARNGSQSIVTTSTGTPIAWLQIPATIRPEFEVRFWVKTNGNPGAASYIYVYALDNTQNVFACGGVNNRLSLVGGLADWTEYTGLCTIPVSRLHYSSAKVLYPRIIVGGNANGVEVWVDDAEVIPMIEPLIVAPLYPNYRGMLWSDQGETATWNAVVWPPDGYAIEDLKVQVQIVDDGESVVDTVTETSLAAAEGNGEHWGGFSVNPMSYDFSGEADGSYLLRGTLRTISGDTEVYAYPDYKIVKEEPSFQRDSWHSWVDKYNRVQFCRTAGACTPKFVWGGYLSMNSFRMLNQTGATDCCQASGLTADNARKYALGCNHRIFPVQNIEKGSPTTFTVAGHGLSTGNQITISGLTGDWSALNGCYYWTGCSPRGEITATDTNTFTAAVNSSGYSGSYDGSALMIRTGACYSDDTAFTSWNRGFGLTGSSLIKIMGDMKMNTILRYGLFVNESPGIYSTGPGCDVYQASQDWVTPWLDALADSDVWFMQYANSWIDDVNPFANNYWADVCAVGSGWAKVADGLQRFVNTKPLGAGFLGFYLADEPLPWKPAETIEASFSKHAAYRDTNTGGVTYWLNVGNSTENRWGQVVDAGGFDPYTNIGCGPDDRALGLCGRPGVALPYGWTRTEGGATFDSRPSWTVGQSFYASGYGFPTLASMKISFVGSVAGGATGYLLWQFGDGDGVAKHATDQSTVANPGGGQAIYDDFARLGKFVGSLMPLLSEPIQDLADREDGQADYGRIIASVSTGNVRCSTRQRGTRYLLVCVNTATSDQNSTAITLVDTSLNVAAVRAWDGSTVAVADGVLTDDFAALNDGVEPENAAHVYVIESVVAAGRIGPR